MRCCSRQKLALGFYFSGILSNRMLWIVLESLGCCQADLRILGAEGLGLGFPDQWWEEHKLAQHPEIDF